MTESDQIVQVATQCKRPTLSQKVLAAFFIFAGVMHFVIEDTYAAIIPESWPYKSEMVQLSGAAEIAGGLGVLVPKTRSAAGKGLIALLIAVFPANINMTLNPEKFSQIPPALLWARLPLQFAAIAWVFSATQRD